MTRRNPWPRRAVRLAGLLAALAFVASGVLKLFGYPPALGAYAHAGYPPWVVVAAGAIETAGGLLLLWPRLTPLGAGVFALALASGAVTHLASGEAARAMLPFVLTIPVGILVLALAQRSVEGVRWRTALNAFADKEVLAHRRRSRISRTW